MNGLPLAWRLAARQWRAGDLRLLLAAGVLAVAITTLIAAFGDRLERALVHRAADLLGADLVLAGSKPPSTAARAVADRHALARTLAIDFSTLLRRPDGEVLLVAVRAVDGAYPLRGRMLLRDANGNTEESRQGPPPGEAWLEGRVTEELQLAIGDHVEVGDFALRVGAIVQEEPDRGGDFLAFSPRVLMNAANLPATGVIQPGSRVRYRLLMAGHPDDVATARDTLDAEKSAHEEVLDVRSGNRRTASALGRALQFLSLASVLGVLLCGATLALIADRQARRLYDTVALLRSFGLSRARVWRVLLLEVLMLAALAAIPGTLLGYAAQSLLAQRLADLLPTQLPPPGPAPLMAGLACAFVALPAFLLPPLARLSRVSPLRALRRDLAPPSTRMALHYALGLGVLAALLLLTATDRTLALALLAGVALLVSVGVPLAAFGLRALSRRRARVSLAWRLATDRLAATPLRSGAQLIAFALIFTTLVLATLLRDDLFASWRQQAPANAPNVFAMNLLPHEQDAFRDALQQRGITPPSLYPVSPGRLLRIGDTPLADRVAADSDAGRSLDRDLALTTATDDPLLIVEGEPITADTPAGFVTVEEKLAKQLELAIGDRLVFFVAGEEITATVLGIRHVDWDSFQPNFFMMLSPGTLGEAPYTLLASFRAGELRPLLRELRAQFPALTLVETGPLLQRLSTFIDALAGGVQLVGSLLLTAALLLLAASVITSLDERLAEAALLRVLGARRSLLRHTLTAEFALLGSGAGLLALAGTELARWHLYTRWLDLPWQTLPALWLLPLVGALVLALAGLLAATRSLSANPAVVLRNA